MKNILIAILIIVAIVLFIRWSNKHDAQAATAYDQYDACVMEQYGTTAASWYQQHGEVPQCQQ